MGTSGKSRLSDKLHAELLQKLANVDTVGILLGGSFARGEETVYSDIDLLVFRRALDPRPGENRYFRSSTEDRLVTWSPTTVVREVERMGQPKTAIWVVPGIRQAVVLLDRDGSIATVKAAAQSFQWESLADLARSYASESLAGLSEEVAKLVAGLARRDAFSIGNALNSLESGLSQAVAVARGTLIETENRWLRMVEDSVGFDTEWSRAHREMLGIDGDRPTTLWERAEAGLRCYLETASLLEGFLRPEDRQVVDLSRRVIERR